MAVAPQNNTRSVYQDTRPEKIIQEHLFLYKARQKRGHAGGCTYFAWIPDFMYSLASAGPPYRLSVAAGATIDHPHTLDWHSSAREGRALGCQVVSNHQATHFVRRRSRPYMSDEKAPSADSTGPSPTIERL